MLLKEEYAPEEVEKPDIGYIFCPEQRFYRPEPLYASDGEDGLLWLFGPGLLPEERTMPPLRESHEGSDDVPHEVTPQETKTVPPIDAPREAPETVETGEASESTKETSQLTTDQVTLTTDQVRGAKIETKPVSPIDAPSEPPEIVATREAPENTTETSPLTTDQDTGATIAVDPVDIVLGTAAGGSQEVEWRVSIKANPHLLMVGLPGMGKTTCLINICRQLAKAAITPIVFSYHDDIDEKLAGVIGPLNLVDYDGLGFNPLRVDSDKPRAHIDVAGTFATFSAQSSAT